MAGLYLHVPFCSQRCVYCDFYFVTTQQTHAGFMQALCAEIEHYGHTYGPKEPVETIYFGGGTPSLLHLDDVARLLRTIDDHFDTGGVQEVTFELNPEDVDVDYLRGLRSLGVDRLSIGVQSFFQADLDFMNRSHTAAQAETVVGLARTAGFDNFSLDLIFGLPEQPFEYWGANLEKAVRLEAPHLSAYGLTVEPRTPLHKQVERGLVTPADEETMRERYLFTMDYLRARGYEHYEISSFARPGQRALHNSRYWEHANYLGFGPSAHSFWWTGLPAHRWANLRNLRRYEGFLAQREAPLDFREALSLDDLANEYLMLRLRTGDGLDLAYFAERYGADLLFEKADELAWLESEELVTQSEGRLRLTDNGKTLADAVTERLLMDGLFEPEQ